MRFDARIRAFWRVVEDSPALQARRRELGDEAGAALAPLLAGSVGRPADDREAALAAEFVMTGWSTAYRQALRSSIGTGDEAAARHIFIELIERGFAGASAALEGTPYSRK